MEKFRAWDKDSKVMRSWKDLILTKDDGDDFWLIGYKENACITSFDHEQILMQSTGLKDKNGVDIFEGDVLLHTSSSVNYSDTYWHSYVQVYRMDSGAYRIKGKHIYDTELMSARNRLEVVGNIYQNQNLLDKEYFSTSDGFVEKANEN